MRVFLKVTKAMHALANSGIQPLLSSVQIALLFVGCTMFQHGYSLV